MVSSKNIIKGGKGNLIIDYEKGIVRKVLRNTSTRENIDRFKKEIAVLKKIGSSVERIVEVIDTNLDTNINNCYIDMKLYTGNLIDLIGETKGNVKFCVNLLLPIVRTLLDLSEMINPIYHRDLKPENILYMMVNNEYKLYLADFGCCYFEDESERLTPDYIAIGSRMYLAPEYELGKVDNVNEKGDIFSLGKILWKMINGIEEEYLPSNFWFVDEYNLTLKFNATKEILGANLIISSCLSINPDDRPSYKEIILMMNDILEEKNFPVNQIKVLRAKEYSAKRKLELVQILEFNKNLVNTFSVAFITALQKMLEEYTSFRLLEILLKEYEMKNNGHGDYTNVNLVNDAAHYLYSRSFDNIYLSISFDPASGDERYGKISFSYTIKSKRLCNVIKLKYIKNVLYCEQNGRSSQFAQDIITEFLDLMIENYIE